MTEVNGLRLAYKGFVGGLAGAYVWAALAMALSAAVHGDPLRPLEPLARVIWPLVDRPELAFVLGLCAVQAGGGVVGMVFAYFFARFFTVRRTMAVAAPAAAILAWALLAAGVTTLLPGAGQVAGPVTIVATLGYGLVLGAAVPLRTEVSRVHASPQTGDPRIEP